MRFIVSKIPEKTCVQLKIYYRCIHTSAADQLIEGRTISKYTQVTHIQQTHKKHWVLPYGTAQRLPCVNNECHYYSDYT